MTTSNQVFIYAKNKNTKDKTRVMATLGPATNKLEHLKKIKERNIDFVRINMSHSSLGDLRYFIDLAKKVDIPFILDTEGSQVRTGEFVKHSVYVEEGDVVKIYEKAIMGNEAKINLRPQNVVGQLVPGDIIYIDFNSLILRVADTAKLKSDGYIKAVAVSGGSLGKNKAVNIDTVLQDTFKLPVLSEKDYKAIEIGLENNVGYVAASFMRNKKFVDEVRTTTKNKMKIISKIECIDALRNLDEIISASDYILIDRGDLSREISIEKIPLAQKIILSAARKRKTEVFVATNLLESMIEKSKPTRAEAHDVVTTILDGAYGLTLSAETAIGTYPITCLNVMNKLCHQAQLLRHADYYKRANDCIAGDLEKINYLLDNDDSSILIKPHGGKLVNRIMRKKPDNSYLESLPKILIDQERQMDVEQIAIGTFSPLEGFMKKKDLNSVLDNMRLSSGEVWTVPIILDVSQNQAEKLSEGGDVALCDNSGIMAILHLEEKYDLNKKEVNEKLYGATTLEHPGARWISSLNPVLLGGKISLLRRRQSEYKEYELTPRQVRAMFEERNWERVVGFHTRNVIHRSHEFIQLEAMRATSADGLFIHPVIGKKKPGDFQSKYIIGSYEKMLKDFYPKDSVVFGSFATFSRYAGPREAIFTALCRKNFGCSHFVVGRDHTGVGNFYHPKASHKIFDQFPDLGIVPVCFDKVFYSQKTNKHIHEAEDREHLEEEKLHISGTQARKMFETGEKPPDWFMRSEISEFILQAAASGGDVFVKEDITQKKGCVLWLTGLSGSGKTSVANELKARLEKIGKRVCIIDGDSVRNENNKHLGFSRDDIKENNRLIANFIKERVLEFDFVLVPVIAPYEQDRNDSRLVVGDNFYLIYLNAPLQDCIDRDPKGLYAKALKGRINNFIGVGQNNPYETPQNPDLEIDSVNQTVDESGKEIVEFLKRKKII